LEVADELEARSVAFPLIGAGVVNRWPQQDAIAVATDALVTAETKVEEIRLVTLERVAFDEIRARSGHRPQREAG
jgi:O-acetyl-ADP-ribose deacetylase (regulator of RNase III)